MLTTGFFTVLMCLFACKHSDGQKDFVEIKVTETSLAKGKKNFILLEVKVKDGYHIQANQVNDEALIPATLEISSLPALIVEPPVFPRHKLFRLEGAGEDLYVFDGTFVIQVPVKVMPDAVPGNYILKGTFRYQACNHKSCFFPRKINIEMKVAVK